MRMLWIILSALIAIMLTGCGSSPQEDFVQRVGQAMKAPASDSTSSTVLTTMRRVAFAAANVPDTPSITPDQLFDWAEATYPQFFPTKEKTLTWSVYQFRYYKDTDVYLAVESGQKVVALGKPTGGAILELGTLILFSNQISKKPSAFDSIPQNLPDLKDRYANTCGVATNMQNAIPVDLNNDGRVDLLLPIWCFFRPGQDRLGPVVNELIALVQNSDGTYEDKTLEVFGTEHPKLNGKNQNWVIADFNGDGRPDIVLGTDKEDGRPIVGNGENMRSQAVALMSGPLKYTIVPFGIPRFGDNVIIVRNNQDKMLLLVITADVQVEMWEYNNGWTQIQNEFSAVNPIQKNPVFINPRNDNKLDNSTYLINNVLRFECNNDKCIRDSYRLELWSKATGSWRKVDELQMIKIKTVEAQTADSTNFWTPTEARVANFEGKDYLDMGFVYDGCSIRMTPTSIPIGLRSFLGDEIIGGYFGQTTLNANYRPPTLKIFPTEVVNDKLVVKSSIITEKLTSNYYRMKCRDLNNDGYDDIMIELGGGGALYYFNDKKGSFKSPKPGIIPEYSFNGFSPSVLYEDLDGDGILDILYYPIISNRAFDLLIDLSQLSVINPVSLPKFKGLRHIQPEDLNH